MTNQDPRESRIRRMRQASDETNEAFSQISQTASALRTETDKASSVLGFGRRILVPADEIHVVVGHGRHVLSSVTKSEVFGQAAEKPSRYFLNPSTQVVKLKTISFAVSLLGPNNQGIEALDSSKVSFRLWAHAVAKLNPEESETAAQRVGSDIDSLISTITQVATAQLVATAATMPLEDIIANRQAVADQAFGSVNKTLRELGYDLAVLTVTRLGGEAYSKLVEQAESRISKETTIATNKEQLAELRDTQSREQFEAEVRAETEKKLASERLEAEEEVESATLRQQEALDSRRHEMRLKQIERDKIAAERSHEVSLAKVQLDQQLGEAEATKSADLARIEAEREADLLALNQKREAEINIARSQAEAERRALEQAKEIERKAAFTQAEAERLKAEELAKAERAREITVVESRQVAEAMKVEAEAEANALKVRTDAETEMQLVRAEAETNALRVKVNAETEMELVRAEAEATATEKRAHAAKIRAEATKAEQAAQGLADAEVDAARVQVAEKQVAVTRAEGLAAAEVSRAKAEAEVSRIEREKQIEVEQKRQLKELEINAQKELADLYEKAPVLIELEKMRMQLDHDKEIATIQAEASLRAFEAIAPGIKVQIIGGGNQTSEIMSNILSLSQGMNILGDEIPVVGQLIGKTGNGDTQKSLQDLLPKMSHFVPHIQEVVGEMNPRILSSLTVKDLVDKVGKVVSGEQDLVGTLNELRQDTSFRMVSDLPVSPMLRLLGIGQATASTETVETIDIQENGSS